MLKRLAPLLPVVVAALVMYVVWPTTKSKVPMYKGLTASQWEQEIAGFSVSCDGLGVDLVRRRPTWKSWLAKVGWRVKDEPADLCLFADVEPEAVPVLTELLKSTNANIRGMAARSIGNRPSSAMAAVPVLVLLLHDSNTDVAEEAAGAVIKIDPEAAKNAGLVWNEDGMVTKRPE